MDEPVEQSGPPDVVDAAGVDHELGSMSNGKLSADEAGVQDQVLEASEQKINSTHDASVSDGAHYDVMNGDQENHPSNATQPASDTAGPLATDAPHPSKSSRKKVEVMDIQTAKAILAEPFDEQAERDRPIPALFKQHPDGSVAPLDGILSAFLTSTTLDLIKCSHLAGQDVAHGTVAPVSKEVIIGDIQFRGAISDFYAFKAAIIDGDLEDLLLRVNANDVYGDGNNFELVVSKAASEVSGKVTEELERRKLRDERIARRALAERSLPLSARDLKIKPWPSQGSEAEVDLMQLRPLREPIVMTMERPRAAFARPNINFVDKDAQEIHAMSASHMELRPYKDPAFELQRRLLDRGVQAVPQQAHSAVQVGPPKLRIRDLPRAMQQLLDRLIHKMYAEIHSMLQYQGMLRGSIAHETGGAYERAKTCFLQVHLNLGEGGPVFVAVSDVVWHLLSQGELTRAS